MSELALSLVIPTFNERENVSPLLGEIETALAGLSWEVVFADDSTDGTDELIARQARRDPRIRLRHRTANLGGLAPARDGSADIVVASRYCAGGSPGGLDGPRRHLVSLGLRLLTKVLFPERLRGVTDPLGGFFLVRRFLVQGVELHPMGYKILLEILVRSPWQTIAEVPYEFRARHEGTSKANLREGLRFLRHVVALRLPKSLRRSGPAAARSAGATPSATGGRLGSCLVC
jgi:dolichol-phosphate mannosyltransferase